jgi:predicted DNA-binding transcriptional regulator AlpA
MRVGKQSEERNVSNMSPDLSTEVARAVAKAMRDVPSVGKTYLDIHQVRRRYGNCSSMAIWRRLASDTLGFPRPIMIGSRRYWVESELDEWDAAQPRWKPGKSERLAAAEGKATRQRLVALTAANKAKAAERAKADKQAAAE